MRRIGFLATAVVMLAACTPAGGDEPAADPAPVPPGGTDCGTFTLGQGDPYPQDGAQCLIDAAEAGRPARLRVTRPTTEGDPIHVTYLAGADGRIEVVTDSREDSFGSGSVETRSCRGPGVRDDELDFAECSEPSPVAPRGAPRR